MENENNTLTNGAGAENGPGAEANNEKKPSFDDVLADKEMQAEFDRRVSQALKTAQVKWEQTTQDKVSEAQKLAKMNAEQKAQYEREQAEAKLAQREADITRRELMAASKDTLLSKGLPVSLAECLTYTDADACNASIEAVSKAFEQAVEKVVNDRLRQAPPKAGNDNEGGIEAAIRAAAGLSAK